MLGLQRVCFQLQVKPGRIAEYKKRHAAVWPDMLRALADLRVIAKRRTPNAAFDYADGSADAELSLARARQAFEDGTFHPAILRDVSVVDTSVDVLGVRSALPFGIAPTGSTPMLRQYFPKGTDLSRWPAEDLEAVALELNNRPRKILEWKTPAEVFEEQIRSRQQTGVTRTH